MVEEYIRMELYIMEVLKCYLWFGYDMAQDSLANLIE